MDRERARNNLRAMAKAGTCFYCGAPATSREHAIPRWIPRHLRQTHLALPHVQAHNVVRRNMVAFADYVGYILCDAATTTGSVHAKTK
jgi:hypothetical protein